MQTGNFTKIVQRVPVRIVLDDDGAGLGHCSPDCRSSSMSMSGRRPAIASTSSMDWRIEE